ncbi:paired immunoglobulin-like type 2 receptor beta [Sphaerodactylus townsendi]|uniref:paired immunoglobulin-like type 2 receptor beta n=1 Tax=Sphaerodactylus townsendi TaxID=933632 RepID=UPI002025DA8B|nr:paired immunoglobulin-like type 2 receptor beta [Sphaerodactylus townsendi]
MWLPCQALLPESGSGKGKHRCSPLRKPHLAPSSPTPLKKAQGPTVAPQTLRRQGSPQGRLSDDDEHNWCAENLVPFGAKSLEQTAQPAKSSWPLKECERTKSDVGRPSTSFADGCVCPEEFQICQPLQLSARVNGSVTLPCSFTHKQNGDAAQVHWRLGGFHSKRFFFNCCTTSRLHTDPDFEGRVSLAKEEGRQHTASIRITDLRESDSGLYFCRVSVGEAEWQTINGTNLTVTARPQGPEGRNNTRLPLSVLVGVPTGAVLLVAAIAVGLLATLLLARKKGHCQKRTQTRGQEEEKEAGCHELPCRGTGIPPPEEPASQPPAIPPGLLYATLTLSDAPPKQGRFQRGGRAAEETTYATVQR